MSKHRPTPTSPADHPIHVAEAAFSRLKPRLDELAPVLLPPVRVDLRAASAQARQVAAALSAPVVRTRILALAGSGTIDLRAIDELETVAWAAFYAHYRLHQSSATHSEVAIPASVIQRAFEVRSRMLKTLEYHLDGDPEVMGRLAHLRTGSGHLDLANDLAAAADLYRQHQRAIEGDVKNYRAGDVPAALDLSEQIHRLLGVVTTPEQVLWRGYAARAAKLLARHYDEAIRVGRFIFYYDDPEARFPSLHAATRTTVGAIPAVVVEDARSDAA